MIKITLVGHRCSTSSPFVRVCAREEEEKKQSSNRCLETAAQQTNTLQSCCSITLTRWLDIIISSYLFFSVNLSPSPLISSMKLSLVTAILHETVQQLFFLLPNEVQPRLLPLHSAEQGLHLADRLHPSSGESLQTFFIGTRLLA
ncbi:unnamed protein product [Sphagnum troendelagicum]|uniref:Uncharacterized protein n=1 Tax=Sphagnum troendelagicum TaxID=128251 RepID=A0ABP0TFV9_9BRYO